MLKVLNSLNSFVPLKNAVLLQPRAALLHTNSQIRHKCSYSVSESGILEFQSPKFSKGFSGRSSRQFVSVSAPRRATLRAMASTGESTSVVEHIVMFRVKDDAEPEKVDAMVRALRSLGDLHPPMEGLIQMSCGPSVAPTSPTTSPKRGPVQSIPFTHALHTRFSNRDALAHYSAAPAHVDVVTNLVKPLVDDICAVDWEASVSGDPKDLGVGVVHAVLFKLKDGTSEEAIEQMVTGLQGHLGTIPGLRDLTIGKNFSPARAKGFEWGLIARFATPDDLAVYSKDRGHLKVMLGVFKNVESFASVDFDCNVDVLAKI